MKVNYAILNQSTDSFVNRNGSPLFENCELALEYRDFLEEGIYCETPLSVVRVKIA